MARKKAECINPFSRSRVEPTVPRPAWWQSLPPPTETNASSAKRWISPRKVRAVPGGNRGDSHFAGNGLKARPLVILEEVSWIF